MHGISQRRKINYVSATRRLGSAQTDNDDTLRSEQTATATQNGFSPGSEKAASTLLPVGENSLLFVPYSLRSRFLQEYQLRTPGARKPNVMFSGILPYAGSTPIILIYIRSDFHRRAA